MITTMLLLVTIVRHYQYNFQIKKIENYSLYYKTFWHDVENRIPFVIEMLVCSVFLPPAVDFLVVATINEGEVNYTADMILTQIILLKSYTLLRVYEHISIWTNF